MKMMVLGSGQDGGIPHTGCYCSACIRARRHKRRRRLAPSVAVCDEKGGACYLVDASPDFKFQMDMIWTHIPLVKRVGKIPVSGILLTHAHYGHITGLLQLGKEVLNERGVPVFCTPAMSRFLSTSSPFNHLVEDGNIGIHEVRPAVMIELGGISVTPIQVPHRNETADTVGYIIEAARRVAYIPDTDRWTDETLEEIRHCDTAIIDGTFYSSAEIPGYRDVPHPPIKETVDLLESASTEIYFTHINHTNAVNRRGREKRAIERLGFKIAYDGLTLSI
ncbi:MAG: MBL fold metallo-hydrolase [Candidatus Eisenbacteria bacterium]